MAADPSTSRRPSRPPAAQPGDRLTARRIHGDPARGGEIVEVLGQPGHERYRVRWDDGHESIVFPADGVSVSPAAEGRR